MTIKRQTVELNDKTFKTFAFNSHVPAYIDGGIQKVPFLDLLNIIAEPGIQEWMDFETWDQAVQVFEIVYPMVGKPSKFIFDNTVKRIRSLFVD